ncbi:MAG: hypothetical protein LBR87_05595 [Synergistaceae bacterium]|jgi:hypothetical protein|nr:hypothetical protein [Synergistaceae bacterium]
MDMTGTREDGRPLDHATARIVAELAAALLPPLTSDMREAVAGEIGRAGSEMTGSFAAAEASVRQSVSELSSGIAARLTQVADELARQSSGQFTALSSALASAKPGLGDEVLEDAAGLLRFLKEAIPRWEGALKADGRMQTRELSEFSAEMSELAKEMKLSLSAVARESAERSAARDEERRKLLEESGRAMERRLTRLEKIVVLTGVVCAFFWTTLLIVLLL